MNEEIIGLIEAELKQIKNVTIQEFVAFTMQKAPAYLALVPSSSTAKYHPPQSNKEPGGLINHLRGTVVFGLRFSRAWGLSDDEQDAVVAACLMHDILKYSNFEKGVEIKQRYTTKTHDYDSALFVHKAALEFKAKTGEDVPLLSAITGAIAWHMGQWTKRANPQHAVKKFPEDYTPVELIVHLADMASSEPSVHILTLDESLVG